MNIYPTLGKINETKAEVRSNLQYSSAFHKQSAYL